MPTNYETEKYEVGDLVIYYGHQGGGSKIVGVVLDFREYAEEVEVAWINDVTSKVHPRLVRKVTENVSV